MQLFLGKWWSLHFHIKIWPQHVVCGINWKYLYWLKPYFGFVGYTHMTFRQYGIGPFWIRHYYIESDCDE